MTVKYIITYDRWLLAPELSHMISQAPECNPMPSYVDIDTGYRVTPHHYCSHLFDWPYEYYNCLLYTSPSPRDVEESGFGGGGV